LVERTAHLALQQLYRLVVDISGWMLAASGPNPGEKVEKKSVSIST